MNKEFATPQSVIFCENCAMEHSVSDCRVDKIPCREGTYL